MSRYTLCAPLTLVPGSQSRDAADGVRYPIGSRLRMTDLRRLVVALLPTVFLLAGACGKDDPTAPTIGPAVLLIAGHAGTDTIGTQPIQALVVEVLDEDGKPLPD